MNKKAFKRSKFVLIRHGLSNHNIRSLIAATDFGKGTKEYNKVDWDVNGFDPELHTIGVSQAQNHQQISNEIDWKIVFTSPM